MLASSALVRVGLRALLVGLEPRQASPLSMHRRNSLFLYRPGCTGDEDSFYEDRWRSHFTAQV
jgi:hypothetical protein